ncbi:MAG: lipid A deacylase LpxR family protein [Proteobacteria bacterium]|nr:lipid A deacylase LpxR family protein [Pseudomonadota bacterium]
MPQSYPASTLRPRARTVIPVLAALLALAAPVAARAADLPWTATVIDDDDYYAPGNRDRHYTHGIRFSGTSGDIPDGDWQAPFRWMPGFPDAGPASRRYEILGGQNMYTPENTGRSTPDPRDRPYAGWLYGGVGVMQDTNGAQFDRFALRLGTIGPSSGAGQLQTKWHLLIQVSQPQGWRAQLRDEPTLDLYRERKWRIHRPLGSGLEFDALPQVSLRVGNVYDYVAAGGMIRLGKNLKVDYGPPHIDENLGATYVNPLPDSEWAWYGFLGTEGRLVGHNIFLDGNSFQRSASVAREIAVADAEAGVAMVWQHLRLAYTYVYRSNEFRTQDHPDHYGSFTVTFRLPF